jgi:hypothetical protein
MRPLFVTFFFHLYVFFFFFMVDKWKVPCLTLVYEWLKFVSNSEFDICLVYVKGILFN